MLNYKKIQRRFESFEGICLNYLDISPDISPAEQALFLSENNSLIDLSIIKRKDFALEHCDLLLDRKSPEVNAALLRKVPSLIKRIDFVLESGVPLEVFDEVVELADLSLSVSAESFIKGLSPQSRYQLIKSRYCPKSWLTCIIRCSDRIDRNLLAEMPCLNEEGFTILHAFQDCDTALARNPNLPLHLINQFARSEAYGVRAAIAGNPSTPSEIVTSLLYDNENSVIAAASERLKELRGDFQLRPWVQDLFGFKSKTILNCISESIKHDMSPSWVVYAAPLLRTAYRGDESSLNSDLEAIIDQYSVRVFLNLKLVSSGKAEKMGRVLADLPSKVRLRLLVDSSWTNTDNGCDILSNYERFRPFLRKFLRDVDWTNSDYGTSQRLLLAIGVEIDRLKTTHGDKLPKDYDLKVLTHFPAVEKLCSDEVFRWDWPKTAGEMESWGNELSNCLGRYRYAQKVAVGMSLLVGLRQTDGKLLCAIELGADGNLIQTKARLNSTIASEHATRANRDLFAAGLTKSEKLIETDDDDN